MGSGSDQESDCVKDEENGVMKRMRFIEMCVYVFVYVFVCDGYAPLCIHA